MAGETCDSTASLADLKCGCAEGVDIDILYRYSIYNGPDGEVPYQSVVDVCIDGNLEVTVDVTAVAPNAGSPYIRAPTP
jgi:hypothetical protein